MPTFAVLASVPDFPIVDDQAEESAESLDIVACGGGEAEAAFERDARDCTLRSIPPDTSGDRSSSDSGTLIKHVLHSTVPGSFTPRDSDETF